MEGTDLDKMTLCMIAPEFLPVWGGTGSYTVELIKHLPKSVDIHVVTLKRSIPGMSKDCSTSLDSVLGRPVKVHYISNSKETFFYNLGFQVSCFRKIPQLHKKYKFDIIHSHHCHMPDVLLQLSHTLRIPTITSVHNMFKWMRTSILKQSTNFQKLDRSEKGILVFYPMLKYLERFYLSNVQSLIAPSKNCREELINFLDIPQEKIHVIYNGVNPEIFAPNRHDDPVFLTNLQLTSRPVVLFVGRIVAQKGLNTLMAAVPRVAKHLPNVLFMFVGAGDFSYYQRQLKEYGVSNENFLNLGYFSYLDMPKIYSLANVFVLPSPHENCSVSLLEAMSCKRAVVAANVGGNSEIIRPYRNGMLFTSENSKELAEIIIQLIEDSNLQKKLGLQARRTVVEKFSVQKMAAGTVKVYEEAVGSYRERCG
jgi:glycosyltransferase involved in cell wall biosynthesis